MKPPVYRILRRSVYDVVRVNPNGVIGLVVNTGFEDRDQAKARVRELMEQQASKKPATKKSRTK